jgi:hypothetical protein
MKDRFDIEEQIIRTGNYADQIRDLAEFMIENEGSYDFDRVHNALVGIAEMIDVHTDKMYNTMCYAMQLNQKNSSPPLTDADDSAIMNKCGKGCQKRDPTAG